jgi:hypothetical protein
MRVNISKITSAINKVADMVAGDKQVPGVLLDLSEDELKVCFTNGHKTVIEKVAVTSEEGDHTGSIIVDFEQFSRAIATCQPSGIIKVDDVVFEYKEASKVLVVSADQMIEVKDADGNVASKKKMATKKIDLLWHEPNSDMRVAILTRMNYEDIFNSDNPDEFDKKELIDALTKTSTEKGKQIYISKATHTIFVANQAHCTSVPVSKKKMEQADIDALREELQEENQYTNPEDLNTAVEKAVEKAESRIHSSVSMTQAIAKSVIGILSKTSSDTVYLFTKDRYCNIYIQNEDETVGIWFEMATVSRAHTSAVERYTSLAYRSYHTLFIREFLADNIKSALNATKNEKIVMKFVQKDDEVFPVLSFAAGSDSASISDNYAIEPSSVVDENNNITEKQFSVSLKVFADMLAQLKTEYVAFDFDVTADGSTSIRLSEVDTAVLVQSYKDAREYTKLLCEQQGIPFVAEGDNATPTPAQIRYDLRDKTLLTKQFTMLSK